MASRIHELQAMITANIAKFNRGLQQAEQQTKSFQAAWGRAARDVGSAATRLTLAVTGVGTAAAVSFAKYESVMIRAQAVTRTSGTEMGKSLDRLAKTMGETTVFSATQAAEAIEQMGLAGLTTKEIHEALGGALQLAASAQVDIATAADISAKTLRAFGADAKELTHINDVLVGTFTRANTDIRQLGEAMKPVAPVSKAMGVSIEDTAAAIAKMSDAGFQGSMAGTSLRNIISRLAGAAPEVTNRLRELGIETLDTAGKMRPLFDILEDIERQGVTDAEVLQLFGARGGPQVLALMEVGARGLREFSAELKGLQGITQEISDRNLESLSSQFALVMSKVNDLALAAGNELKPALVDLFSQATKWMSENKTAVVALATEGFAGLVNYVREFIASAKTLAPNLLEISHAMRQVLVPVLQFLAESPRLVQVLLILRGAQMFGVITAITSLGTAMSQTALIAGRLTMALAGELIPIVKSLGTVVLINATTGFKRLAAAIMANFIPSVLAAILQGGQLVAAMSWWQMGLAGGGVGLAIAGIGAFAAGMMNLAESTKRATEQQQEYNRAIQIGLDMMDKKFEQGIEGGNLRGMRAGLQQQREQALAMQRAQLEEAAKADARGRNRGPLGRAEQALRNSVNFIPGVNIPGDPIANEAATNRDAAAATQRRIQKLDQQIAELDKRIAGQGRFNQWENAGQAQNVAPGGGAAPGGAVRRANAQAADDIAKALRAAFVGSQEQDAPGFGALRDFMGMEGMTGGTVGKYAQFAFGANSRQSGRLAARFNAAGGDPGQLDRIAKEFAQSMQQAAEAAEATRLRTEQANEAARNYGERLLELKNKGELSGQVVEELANKGVALRDSLISGNMSIDEFSRAMRGLENATNAATEAARREEEQRRREALLRGDFAGAGLDFRTALQDRIAQFRMQQFNGAVEQAFNNMFGLNRAMSPVTQAFGTLQNRLEGVNTRMSAPAGGGNAPGAGQAMGLLGAFLGSPGGQVANLRNQISLLQQNLGLVDTYRQRRRILSQISQLESQIAAISRPRVPVFGDMTGDIGFRDPGIQQSVNQISVSFPNLTRMSNTEVSQMADRLQAELERRGRRL